jgi:hypothetical protein
LNLKSNDLFCKRDFQSAMSRNMVRDLINNIDVTINMTVLHRGHLLPIPYITYISTTLTSPQLSTFVVSLVLLRTPMHCYHHPPVSCQINLLCAKPI